ncbi:hypothetical protein E2C01_028974 [Portunus trituberculatus]|uniref:Uncharacterized protein n=1 Tax=Portunus trituberculatus TaxID=210409 RepID=A0A5B7EQZ3_PORTR|nr:hypothetical protein [Portunus trituberculatus]
MGVWINEQGRRAEGGTERIEGEGAANRVEGWRERAGGWKGKQIHEATGKKSGRHCSELPTPDDPKQGDVTATPAPRPRHTTNTTTTTTTTTTNTSPISPEYFVTQR